MFKVIITVGTTNVKIENVNMDGEVVHIQYVNNEHEVQELLEDYWFVTDVHPAVEWKF